MKLSATACALLLFFCWGEILQAADEAPPQITFIVNRSKKKRGDDSQQADFDDKNQIIKLIVKISNKDFRDFEGLKCRITLVGEVMDDYLKKKHDDVYVVLDRQEIPFSLEKAKDLEVETKPIGVRFDESDSARFGARYLGYVISIFDKNGKRFIGDTDRVQLLSNFDAVESLKVLTPFDRDLKDRKEVSINVEVKHP